MWLRRGAAFTCVPSRVFSMWEDDEERDYEEEQGKEEEEADGKHNLEGKKRRKMKHEMKDKMKDARRMGGEGGSE